MSARLDARGHESSSPAPPVRPGVGPGVIHVVVADEDRLVRQAIRRRLARESDLHAVAETTYGGLVAPMLRYRDIDVVVMDLQPTLDEGLLAVRTLTATNSRFRARVVVITVHESASSASAAVDAGASGYLLKSRDIGLLPLAVRAAWRGETVISSAIHTGPPAGVPGRFTPLERALLRHLCTGPISNEELASTLGLSVNAVRGQLAGCLRKVGLKDRAQLARWALRHGFDHADGQP